MAKEITELKATNSRILEALSTLNDKLTLLGEFRDENTILRATNHRLIKENNDLTRAINANVIRNNNNVNESVINMPPFRTADNTDGSVNAVPQMEALSSAPFSPTAASLQVNDDEVATVDSVSQMETIQLLPLPSTQAVRIDALRAIEPQKWIFIANLHPSTSCEEMKAHILANKDVERTSLNISRITPKSIQAPFYAAFKVGVPARLFDEIVNPVFWPGNVKIREFFQRGGENFRLISQENRKN